MHRNYPKREHKSKFVTFRGTLERKYDGEEKKISVYEVRVHINNIILRNEISEDPETHAECMTDLKVIVAGTVYYVDEKTYRRLLSCQRYV